MKPDTQERSTLRTKVAMSVGVTLLAGTMLSAPAQACPSQPLLGGMCAFGGNYTIRGWASASGTLLPIAQYTAMFSLVGTTYGGDGRTTFGLPDLRGRAPAGVGNGPGLSDYRWGQKLGVEFVTLSVNQIPNHNHAAQSTASLSVADADVNVAANLIAYSTTGNSTSPSANVLAQNSGAFVYTNATPDVMMSIDAVSSSANASVDATATTTLANAGAGQQHENRMPYLAVNWLIALQGIYPSRN